MLGSSPQHGSTGCALLPCKAQPPQHWLHRWSDSVLTTNFGQTSCFVADDDQCVVNKCGPSCMGEPLASLREHSRQADYMRVPIHQRRLLSLSAECGGGSGTSTLSLTTKTRRQLLATSSGDASGCGSGTSTLSLTTKTRHRSLLGQELPANPSVDGVFASWLEAAYLDSAALQVPGSSQHGAAQAAQPQAAQEQPMWTTRKLLAPFQTTKSLTDCL